VPAGLIRRLRELDVPIGEVIELLEASMIPTSSRRWTNAFDAAHAYQ
jgi:hypothetical protein